MEINIMMIDDKINNLSLLTKYQAVLIENDKLKAENKKLREQLGILKLFSAAPSGLEPEVF